MKSLGEFLSKYKKIVSIDRKISEAVISAVYQHTNIKLDRKQLEVKGQGVFIKAPSPIKSEIFLKRLKIIEEVQKNLGPDSPKIIV